MHFINWSVSESTKCFESTLQRAFSPNSTIGPENTLNELKRGTVGCENILSDFLFTTEEYSLGLLNLYGTKHEGVVFGYPLLISRHCVSRRSFSAITAWESVDN